MNLFTANYKRNQIKDEEWFSFEKHFLIPLSLTAIFFAFVSACLNIIIGFNQVLITIPFISMVIFLVVYYLAKKGQHLVFAKWLFIGTTLIIINLVWYYNYGARGPWLFLLVLLYSYLIFMMSGRQLLILSILLIINILSLFFYEYQHPFTLGNYPSEKARILDFYSAILLSGATAYVLMTMAKRAYTTQYKKAKMADKLKSSFLANMSHEIRTPLNAIVGFSNLLADGTIKEEEREEYIAIINSSNETLLQLIDDILDVSMIEANQLKTNEEPFSVNELLKKLEMTYQPILAKKKKNTVRLKLNIPAENHIITSDPIRINQLMVNLLNNAIKFTEKGFIEIGFYLKNNTIRFFIKDTGIGIEQEHLEHLFDRFYKIEDDKSKLYRGTGIGLYLCKKIAEMLNGTISVTSEPGKGSEFIFSISAKNLVVKHTDESKKKLNLQASGFSIPDSTVLLIEDDLNSRIYFRKIMEELHLTILEAPDGPSGIKLFKENPDIALVLLDIRLPGISGFDVLKELKKINPNIPVIAQTAFAMAGDKEDCMAAGFKDYISKPVNRHKLIQLLQKYI